MYGFSDDPLQSLPSLSLHLSFSLLIVSLFLSLHVTIRALSLLTCDYLSLSLSSLRGSARVNVEGVRRFSQSRTLLYEYISLTRGYYTRDRSLLVFGWFEATGDSPVRSYLAGNAGSRPISEAKQPWACLVLGWGTTGEAHVLYSNSSLPSLSVLLPLSLEYQYVPVGRVVCFFAVGLDRRGPVTKNFSKMSKCRGPSE